MTTLHEKDERFDKDSHINGKTEGLEGENRGFAGYLPLYYSSFQRRNTYLLRSQGYK